MNEKSHDESNHICQQLHALVIGQFNWLVNLAYYVGQYVSHILIVHEL